MSTETPKQRAELVNKLVDEASMVNTLRSEIKSLNEQLYESKSDCEQLAIRLASRACVPADGPLVADYRKKIAESGHVTLSDFDSLAAPAPAGERVSVPVDDSGRGLYGKYLVTRRNDPAGKHANCEYFVLDLVHDKFSFHALSAYAKACSKEFPRLADDLMEKISIWEPAHPAAEPAARSADAKAGEDDWCPCTGPAAADGPCCDAYGRRCRIAAGQPFASGQVDELAHLLNGLTRLADELSEDGLEQSAVIIRDGAIRIGEIVNSIAAGQPFVEESAGPIQTRSGWFDRGRAQGLREAAKLSRSLDYHCACYEAIEALLK